MVSQHCKIASICIGIAVVIVVCVTVPIVVLENQKNDTAPRKMLNTPSKNITKSKPISIDLSVAELVTMWKTSPNWHIVDTTYGNKLISNVNDTLVVRYPKRSYNPSGPIRGGFQFYASPSVFPTMKVKFSYQVLFPKKFNWVKGGKLPGIWIGSIGANGGEHIDNGASFRLMWRDKGELEAYVYVPTNQSTNFIDKTQAITNNEYGVSLWRGRFNITAGSWTNISLVVVMNTATDKYDGVISLTVNNITTTFDQMYWGDSHLDIAGLMMHTFFGGSDSSWATTTDQTVSFKNFQVTNIVV